MGKDNADTEGNRTPDIISGPKMGNIRRLVLEELKKAGNKMQMYPL